jgi:type I restriction enzyme S subunit
MNSIAIQPDGWQIATLGDAIERIDTGVSPRTLDRPVSQGEMGVLKVSAVTWGTFRPEENKALPPDLDVTGIPTVGKGDLLLSRANTAELLASPVIVDKDYPNLILSDKTLRLVPNRLVSDPRFLFYGLHQPEARRFFFSNATGTSGSMRNVSQATIRRCPIPLPPLSEQKRIADILDKADAIRRKRQEAIEQCNDFLTSAFVTLFGDPVLNPKKWPETTLEEVAHLQSGVTKGRHFADQPTVDVPYMRVWNVQDGHLRLDDIKDITVFASDVQKYSLERGDLLLTEGGDPDQLGRGAIWYAQIPVCIHQNHIFRVRCDQKLVIPEFLSALIRSQKGKRYFLKMAKQTTGIASINMAQLRKCPVFLPPLHVQEQFAKLDRQFEQTSGTLKKTLNTVDQLFRSLVQCAFRGDL